MKELNDKERLARYDRMKECGLLLELEVPIGSEVYYIEKKCDYSYCSNKTEEEKEKVREEFCGRKTCEAHVEKTYFDYADIPELGKTILTSIDVAYKKLEEMEE